MSESLTLDGWRVGGVDSSDAAAEIAALEDVLREPDSRAEPVSGRRFRRGALVRRMLLVADITGFMLAFALANVLVPSAAVAADRVSPAYEYVGSLAAIPLRILLLSLSRGSTTETKSGPTTRRSMTSWGRSEVSPSESGSSRSLMWRPTLSDPELLASRLRLLAVVLIPGAACGRPLGVSAPARVQAERGHCRCRQRGTAPGVEADESSRVRGINLVGFVDDRPTELDGELAQRLPLLLGVPSQLREVIEQHRVDRVIFAFSNDSHESVLANIRAIRDLDVQVDIVPRYFEVFGGGAEVHTLEGIPLVGLRPTRLSRSSRVLKRAFDLCAAGLGLILLAPLFGFVALWIKLESPGPVFFRQIRRGLNETTFRIYKFRTMVAEAEDKKSELVHLNMHRTRDPRMTKIPDDPRVTRSGRYLRRFSIDELPQLINVIKGEMSLVGPRPLILEEDAFVQEWARRRLDIKPGITGLWQVLGRSDIPFDEMTKLDYVYVTNWSLREDVRLIFLTVPSLFRTRRAF